MATRNVVLPDPLEQDINELVETGRYQNRSEVIRAGLRLLLQQEAQAAPYGRDVFGNELDWMGRRDDRVLSRED